jgi:hypothetical protein
MFQQGDDGVRETDEFSARDTRRRHDRAARFKVAARQQNDG